jgi:maltooligosyltrehalose trehalohydrolase
LRGHQFVVCTQNHDQIGNRAVGDRLGSLVDDGRLKVAAALLLTSPFTPMLFQGEEWAASTPFQYFTDHPDPTLGRAVSVGRRREFAHFGWDPADVPDPQAESTFARSRLDWSEIERAPHAEVLRWYRDLIALRREWPELADPRRDTVDVTYDEDARWLAVRRGRVAVLVNLGEADHAFDIHSSHLLAASDPSVRQTDTQVVVTPDAVALVAQGV